MNTVEYVTQKNNSLPLYKQVIVFIKTKIFFKEWPIGYKIPSQRTLANIFQVNRSTINAAIDELVADGILESHVGSGTLVIKNAWSILADSNLSWNSYVKESLYKPNLLIEQKVNSYRVKSHQILLGSGEISPTLYPKDIMDNIFYSLSKDINSLGYDDPKGILPLRKALCTYLKQKDIVTSPDSILIVSGASQALQLISVGLLNTNTALLTEKPSFLYTLKCFQSAHIKFHGLESDNDGIKLNSLTKAKRENSACLYTIPSFQNPTGILMSKNRRKDIFSLCQQKQIPIIEDDVYGDLWLDNPIPAPIKSFDKQGLVLYLGSFSKSFSPGLRIGWVVGPQEIIDRLADIKNQIDFGTSVLSQWTAYELLSSNLFYEHLKNQRIKLKNRRDMCIKILCNFFMDIATWKLPIGGFYIWLKLNKPISLEKLFFAANKQGILINPGNLYDISTKQHIRISYSYTSESDMIYGLEHLAKLIKMI